MAELDAGARAYLDAVAAAGGRPVNELNPEQARAAALAAARTHGGAPEPVERVEDLVITGPAGPLRARLYGPSGGRLPLHLYLHGGGWVTGDLDTHDTTCRGIANRSGGLVLAVDYRCAPEHRFPAALEDSWAALAHVADAASEVGADPDRLSVGGDSAGGNLAAVLALRARERGGPRLRGQVLIYPVTEQSLEMPSTRANATGYGLTLDAMRWYWEQYLGPGGDHNSWETSPLQAADLGGLPPALVITCQYDPLRDEGNAYARRLAEAGVEVEAVEEPGMIHGYIRLAGTIPRAQQSWERIGAFLRRVSGS